jgi:hypothetical protein
MKLAAGFTVFALIASSFVAHAQSARKRADSVTVAIAPGYNEVNGFHRLLFGENYRKLWAVALKIRVLHLQQEKGGLTISQLGGGLQTKSLRLRDATGHEWVLRTVQKYPERALPPNLRKTVAKDILQDQISTSNPFAALTVPPLADALGIPHSNPEIVYIGDDPGLGKYRKDFANGTYLFEEREPEEAEDTDNTHKVQEKRRDDNDVKVADKLVLRARLLDMVLGDWDRHDDQWRWEKEKNKDSTVYTPIPRDRDQVYYKTSGIFPWIVAHQWLKTKFQPYRGEIRDVKTWNFNARYFDRYFLPQLGEQDWKDQIQYVQTHLTDEVVEKAMHRLPDSIYKLSGPEIISTLKVRRNNLSRQGMDYYRFLSQVVEIPTTDKREHFVIDEQSDGRIAVTVHKVKKDDGLAQVTYQRTFDPAVTREIRLYGFDGKDVFKVTGRGRSPIKVRMVGGGGVDTFEVAPTVNNRKNLYIYDRSDKENILPDGSLAKLRLSTDTGVNNYDRKSYQYDRFQPIVLASYNNDYGVSLVGGFAYTRHGFRKEPYDFRHELLMNYSLARHSFLITYSGDYKKLIGNNDLSINVLSRGPNSVNNFFGIGNNTVFPNEGRREIEYYRNRYDWVNADVRIGHTYGNFRVNAGIAGQFYHSSPEDNDRRFLLEYNQANPQQDIFSNRYYAGLVAGLDYDTRNKAEASTAGVYWHTTLTGMQKLNQGGDNRYGQLVSEFSFYVNPWNSTRLVIANRTGAGTTIGNAEYFQLLKIGGPQTLRGFHTYRFTGKTMAYNNLELRFKVLDFNSYLFPGSVGVIGFNDVGRVWVPGEKSDQWHDGYGGGLYVAPADMFMLQYAFGFSKENALHYISFGYRF